ncbi:MAG TPA: hypothetical protein VGA78_10250 [Gemmatimonadales bacterium]
MTRDDPSIRGLGLMALAGICGYVFLAWRLGVPFAIPVGVIGAVSAAVILRGPLGKAIARRLEGPAAGPGDEVFGELDDLRNRVSELEERQDFTERLLTQARDGGHLAGHLVDQPDEKAHE